MTRSGSLLVAGTTSDAGKSRGHHRPVPGVRPARAAGRAVQGPEHVEQLDGRTADGARDRPRPVGAGGRRPGRARGGDEPGAAQARQRPAQPRRGDGPARRATSRRASSRTAGRRWPRRRSRRTTTCAARYDVVVCEGAGSPAEINLRAERLREHGPGPARPASRRCWSATSTAAASSPRCTARSALLDAADQGLMAGFVVNKFRGDVGAAAPRSGHARTAHRPPGATACCRGSRTSGWTREDALALRDRAAGAGRRGGPHRARRGRGAPAHLQLHRRRRAGSGARARRVFADTPARAGGRRRGRAAWHPRDPRGPRLAAGARPRPTPWPRTRRAAAPCSASAAASRCSAGRSRSRRRRGHTGCSGRRAPPARRTHRVRHREGAAPADRVGAGRARVRLRDPPRPGESSTRARPSWAEPVTARCSARCGTAVSRATTCAGPGSPRWRAPSASVTAARSFAAAQEARIDALADADGGAPRPRRRSSTSSRRARPGAGPWCAAGSREAPVRNYFLDFSVPAPSEDSAAMNASWGTSTRPTIFIRFLPSFCFSSSLRLRVMSPP